MTEPHQRAMPVLLVGGETAECVNFGQPSGNVVAIVPGSVGESAMTVWFGPPDLPENVDASWIATARAHARAEDLVTFTAGEIAAARRRGGAPLEAADRIALDHEAARLILEHSPEERARREPARARDGNRPARVVDWSFIDQFMGGHLVPPMSTPVRGLCK
jgi:hypothetical protein